MNLEKDPSHWSRLKGTKLFRAPGRLLNQLRYRSVDKRQSIQVQMKLGHKIELSPTQDYLFRVLLNRTYHDDGVEFLAHQLRHGSVILDIGANIGLLSCAYAQRLSFLDARIYAFEAVERNFEKLRHNLELNHFQTVTPLRLALGDQEGELTFHLPDSEFSGNAVGDNVLSTQDFSTAVKESSHVERVPMTTLDRWARSQNIERCDFIKIDVEGAELNVLRGGRDLIQRTRPIIQCEFNRYWLAQQGLGIEDYLSFFSSMNYRAFKDTGSAFVPLDTATFTEGLVDVLFYPWR